MAIFDPYINSVNHYIEELRKNDRQERVLFSLSDTEAIRSLLTVNTEQRSGSSIVLKTDTFLELGSPAAGSCAITLYTDKPGLLKDGRITLLGPDVKESPSKVLPFGQVIMAGGEHLTHEDYELLLQYQNISYLIKGYMIRSTTENIWCRISLEAAQKGFSFEVLGTVLIRHIKSVLPKVESVEVLFVTSTREDIVELNNIGQPVREIARNIKEKIWKDRGVDIFECKPGGHCGSCADKSVCDNIRKIGAGTLNDTNEG